MSNLVYDKLSSVAIYSGLSLKTTSSIPTQYRMMKKLNGEVVLQGGYGWWDNTETGVDWKDIPTEEENNESNS